MTGRRVPAVYLCSAPAGGPCPRCGFETERPYPGGRMCMTIDGGCGWSDYEPDAPDERPGR
jgi:hypothetical protein